MPTDSPRAPLEDVMLAMDVVDTLRHRQGLVERELSAGDRRTRLIEQLRDTYHSQGIEVTDGSVAFDGKRLRTAGSIIGCGRPRV